MLRIRTEKGIIVKKSFVGKSNEDYVSDLDSIKGIGPKTLKDILRLYPSFEKLIADKGKLPFRDDISKKLDKYITENE